MEISVTHDGIENILKEVKNQFISFSISNDSGKWSNQYFSLADVKEFTRGGERTIVVLLNSLKDSECIAVDVNLICGFKFNKYLNVDGRLTDEIRIVSKGMALQLS